MAVRVEERSAADYRCAFDRGLSAVLQVYMSAVGGLFGI